MPVRRAAPVASKKLPPALPDSASPGGITVKRSDVVNKDIITRAEGKQLGKATQMWIDTRRWEVISLDCRPSTGNKLQDVMQGGGELYSVLLGSLRQIGDVILVQDTRALETEDYSYGYDNIMSWDLFSESGETLGKV